MGFILNTPEGQNPKSAIFKVMLNSPAEKTFVLFSQDYDVAKKRLLNEGFIVKDGHSLNELAKINKVSPFELIAKLIEK